jgi:hypothetical protein
MEKHRINPRRRVSFVSLVPGGLAIFRQSWRERCLDTLMVVNVFTGRLPCAGQGPEETPMI